MSANNRFVLNAADTKVRSTHNYNMSTMQPGLVRWQLASSGTLGTDGHYQGSYGDLGVKFELPPISLSHVTEAIFLMRISLSSGIRTFPAAIQTQLNGTSTSSPTLSLDSFDLKMLPIATTDVPLGIGISSRDAAGQALAQFHEMRFDVTEFMQSQATRGAGFILFRVSNETYGTALIPALANPGVYNDAPPDERPRLELTF